MELDTDKIDEAVLGLLYLALHDGVRAWKGLDWDALNRLYEKGLISNPVSKAKSVVFTDEGLKEAGRLFEANFTQRTPESRAVVYGNAKAQASVAAGTRGILCRSAIDNRWFFRVAGANGDFTDYELRHDDLSVTIAPDELASFYTIGDERVLDHSPEVLGLKVEDGATKS